MELFEVGGCVRDEIMGIKSKDIDFSVVLNYIDKMLCDQDCIDPYDFMVNALYGMGVKVFTDDNGRPIGADYFTVRGQAPKDFPNHSGRALDFVLARKEGDYTDGRRPDSVEVGTLMDDLARRDFTFNAIAKAPDGSYIDPFNGREDIAAGIIRAVGDPVERLTEDALRAVRALRFSVTKGFKIDMALDEAMEDLRVISCVISKISDERIKDELSKMFQFDTLRSLEVLSIYPLLTGAIFAGSVSLDATMKTKGRNKPQPSTSKHRKARNGCKCQCHVHGGMHMVACC